MNIGNIKRNYSFGVSWFLLFFFFNLLGLQTAIGQIVNQNITLTCADIQLGELGLSTDDNNDASFSDLEWELLGGNLEAFYNAEFGHPICSDTLPCIDSTCVQEYQLIEVPCGALMAKRRYRPNLCLDANGNPTVWTWTEQSITVNYIPNWTLTFPADIDLTCADGNIPPIATAADIIDGSSCDSWALDVSQDTFEVGSDFCMKIERTYELINDCSYTGQAAIVVPHHPNGASISHTNSNGQGRFIYTQIVKLSITEAPTVTINDVETCIIGVGDAPPYGEEDISPGAAPFECDDMRSFSASATNCFGTQLSDFSWKMNVNGVLSGQGTGADFTWIVQPKVEYEVEFWANDGCGNTAGETKIFEFWDCKRPTPYVIHGLTVNLGQNGTFQLWADDLNQGSFDNCTDQADLEMYIAIGDPTSTTIDSVEDVRALGRNVILDCDDIGTTLISFYLVDAEGNWDVVGTFVAVQVNNGICDNRTNPSALVGGRIIDPNGCIVEEVSVSVNGGSQDGMTTGPSGFYQFNLPLGGDYTITPEKDLDPSNGVSTYDLVLISKHILGITTFDSPYKYIAADINRSGTITAFDMVQLRQLILNINTEFSNNNSWRFVDAQHSFAASPLNPAAQNFAEFFNLNNLSQNKLDLDFIGVKIGDVNGNAASGACGINLNVEPTESPFLKLFMNTQVIPIEKENEVITMPIKVEKFNKIAAVEFTIDWDTTILEYVGHNMVSLLDGHLGNTKVSNGRLSYLWFDNSGRNRTLPNGTTIYEVQFKLLRPVSTDIIFDEISHLPTVVRDNSNLFSGSNLASSRFNNPLVVSKPILIPGRIIINPQVIPTLSQWSLFIFALLLINLSLIMIFQKEVEEL